MSIQQNYSYVTIFFKFKVGEPYYLFFKNCTIFFVLDQEQINRFLKVPLIPTTEKDFQRFVVKPFFQNAIVDRLKELEKFIDIIDLFPLGYGPWIRFLYSLSLFETFS